MTFTVVPGVPEMQAELHRLTQGAKDGTLDAADVTLAKKLFKAIGLLASNPRHPGLQSHEIAALSRRYSGGGKPRKVFQSYLENNTPGAGRLYWVYGPGPNMITLVGLEPHPEDRKGTGYQRVALSQLPELPKAGTKPPPTDPTAGGRGRRK
ncbi:MAG: hypothetical protein U0974_06830 [Gemmatimonadales bacterium]|nr:hypothetical protein [Gemmatimonadales bacterium]MDZ4389426.1 hypothetical protein [Gemmatimonadales bacterium]